MFERILVVCTGNVCRSPVGAALLKKGLPEKIIESAGISALVGKNPEIIAKELALNEGLDLSSHQARQVTAKMTQEFDLILTMTQDQRRYIGQINPVALGKIMLFGEWLQNDETGNPGLEIPDPYRKSRDAFIHVHNLLLHAADTWKKKLSTEVEA